LVAWTGRVSQATIRRHIAEQLNRSAKGHAVKRAYKLRAYPTRPQEGRAVRLLADHRDLYNAALQERREAWRLGKVRVAYGDQSSQLKEIRAADRDGQGRHSFTGHQQTLRRLNVIFGVYFNRARDTKGRVRRAGYPRFKPYQRFDQVLWAYATFQTVGRVKVNSTGRWWVGGRRCR
jgi:hypothetical protein